MQPSSPLMFTVVESIGPWKGEAWAGYLKWSGLSQLRELISFDECLCPSAVPDLIDEDWQHNICADYRVHLFRDLDYLLSRVGDLKGRNVLALWDEPSLDRLGTPPALGFVLRGFDLAPNDCYISALTNCGGFDQAFQDGDLNPFGLLDDLDFAYEVRGRLRREYPEDPHADCLVWAIWRQEMARA